ncbi:MAG TPA: metallophosphoesterase [Thermoleophilaceae bacterium]|nr:metallophosphoesterase [Thermoleophilaceae bacterium]
MSDRNLAMAGRIAASPVRYPFSFVVAGDSGAWPDPTADGLFGALVRQAAALEPPPLFFANLGDFAGPGTSERHEHYLGLVEGLPFPDICVVGNHDLDAPGAPEAWQRAHGPMNFEFAHGHTRFIAIDAAPRVVHGRTGPDAVEGPREEALSFLARSLEAAAEPHRVVLMHCPPHFGGRFEPHPEWGFDVREAEFLELVRRRGVRLVCCAHALFYDHFVDHDTHFVVSGGGGTALCSHYRGVCTPGDGRPEDRGALFHAVQLVLAADGGISGRVLQAFEPVPGAARFVFA